MNGQTIWSMLVTVIIGYLLGSVNASIILTKLIKNDDIRRHGSGNAGMTNVMRTLGALPGILTFVFDFLKCAAAIALGLYVVKQGWLGTGLPEDLTGLAKYAAGFGCLLGHIFPLYFGFKGGKGIVTTTAMVLLLDYRIFLPALLVFSVVFVWKRTISLSSVTAVSLYPVFTWLVTFFLDYRKAGLRLSAVLGQTVFAALIAAIVLFAHRSNIQRLRKGEEKPLSFGKKSP